MANRYRGEIDAELDGKRYRLCLTLGALAELETLFGVDDMVALAARFESGTIRAVDAQRIIGAGLRGGGHDVSDDEVARMKVDGGAAGYVALVAKLLNATFGDAGAPVASRSRGDSATRRQRPCEEGGRGDPFRGTT